MTTYLFGDTDVAAQRLRVVAEVYAEATRPFLRTWATYQPRLAVDLGCGPGYSTRLVAEVFQGEQTVGLDNSAHFIALAQQEATERLTFYLHDVTCVPFPVAPGELFFCRLLLTHMSDPQALIARWATQLQPHGLLLMQEVEWIRTNSPVFTTYLAIQQATLAQQSNQLYIGPILHELPAVPLLKRCASEVQRVPVAPLRAAMMFWLNLQTWKRQPFVQTHYAPAQMEQLEAALRQLAEAPPSHAEIEWGMRQLVYERL
jgi:trans-aconitate 2-methyltransferase